MEVVSPLRGEPAEAHAFVIPKHFSFFPLLSPRIRAAP